MYWSRSKNMWLPVAPPTPEAMFAARNAAAEVANGRNETAAALRHQVESLAGRHAHGRCSAASPNRAAG